MRATIDEIFAAAIVNHTGGVQAVDRRHQRGGPVHHGGIHHLALAGLLRFEEGRDDAQRQVQGAATKVAHQVEGRCRRLAAPADGMRRAGEGNIVDIVTRCVGKGPRLPPAGNPAIDEPRIASQTRLRTQTQPLHHARSQAFDQGARLVQQTKRCLDARRRLEIDSDRTATAIHD